MDAVMLLNDFYDIFHGTRNKFVVHEAPFNREASGKLKASRVFYALKNPSDKSSKEKRPVRPEDYLDHLYGKRGCAVEPLLTYTDQTGTVHRDVCFYGVIDVDVYGGTAKFMHLLRRMYAVGWKFTAFRSKSGGLHIYFMFRNAEKASDVTEILKRIITVYGLDILYTDDKHKSKVEYFPMHVTEVPGEDGKCVFLPYFNSESPDTNGMLSLDGSILSLEEAVRALKASYTSVDEMRQTLASLPYSDAPFCIQMLALTGALGQNSGRNKFLFHSCVYFRKKLGKDADYLDNLMELDACMESPLQEEDAQGIQDTYASANSKEWAYSCKHDPMCSYCNRAECKERKYTALQKTNANQNEVTGADMMGKISRVLARQPYYLWEIQAPGKEPKQVRFESAAELRNQLDVQVKCIDQLGWMPQQVKANVWIDIVNSCMEGIDSREITVSAESDTSELNELHMLLVKYLTHRQVQNGAPYMVNAGQVYHADGRYWFSTEGVKDYLRIERYTLGRTNLREELLRFGCEEGTLSYKTKGGRDMTIRCWVKDEDAELETRLTYYDDMYEQDALRAAAIKLADKEVGTPGTASTVTDEDSRF